MMGFASLYPSYGLTSAADDERGPAMKLHRRRILQIAAGAAALPVLPRIASALDYPTRPVRLIVGYSAGSAPDIAARLIAQSLSERLGQQFVTENKPGA